MCICCNFGEDTYRSVGEACTDILDLHANSRTHMKGVRNLSANTTNKRPDLSEKSAPTHKTSSFMDVLSTLLKRVSSKIDENPSLPFCHHEPVSTKDQSQQNIRRQPAQQCCRKPYLAKPSRKQSPRSRQSDDVLVPTRDLPQRSVFALRVSSFSTRRKQQERCCSRTTLL